MFAWLLELFTFDSLILLFEVPTVIVWAAGPEALLDLDFLVFVLEISIGLTNEVSSKQPGVANETSIVLSK